MEVEHIILFSDNQGNETEELTSFGLTEGSNHIHAGQGTRCLYSLNIENSPVGHILFLLGQ